MELTFEGPFQLIGPGHNPAGVHFDTNNVQVFYINDTGRLEAVSAETPEGNWENLQFSEPILAASDNNVTHVTLKSFPRFGVYGTWWSDNRHRLAIYEFEYILSEYVEEGTITSRINDPVVGLQLILANPDEVLVSEDDESILTPGARLTLYFRAGDSEPLQMGTFYVSRIKSDVSSAEVQVEALNTIGKALKEQSFDEYNVYPVNNLSVVIENILINAGINQYEIDTSNDTRGMQFQPDMSFLEGLQALLSTVEGWKLHELPDGTVVAGSVNFERLPQPGRYTFYRNKDIFSRSKNQDDTEIYSRVCVRSEIAITGIGTVTATALNVRPEPNTKKSPIAVLPNGTTVEVLLETGNGWLQIRSGNVEGYVNGQYVSWQKSTETTKIHAYADVPYHQTWGLAKQKTLYVDAPKGTTQEEIDLYAQQLAERIALAGIIESFTGPIRPQIQNGDEAEIISDMGSRVLGLITEYLHRFGKVGFQTDFTVDSGGTIGKEHFSDSVAKIAGKSKSIGATRLY